MPPTPPTPPTPPAPDSQSAKKIAKVQIRRFTLGPYATNCYVVTPEGHSGCWIVDASFEPEPMIEAVREGGAEPEALILTHAHIDHIAGVAEVRRAFPAIPIVIHEAEREWLNDPVLNLSAMGPMEVTAPGPDRTLADGETLRLGPTEWRVLHTPGHSPGGIVLHCQAANTAFGGDSLFAGSIGRTDFPGCDHETLVRSIRTKIYTLPRETKVLPGHGPATTVGQEMLSNPYVRA
jgi:hydroxyacylglutathione hydrolase